MDEREEILNNEYNEWVDQKGVRSIYPPKFPAAYKDSAINAMDENAKRLCLELLEYMAKNGIELDIVNGEVECYLKNGEGISKEQLFENFL